MSGSGWTFLTNHAHVLLSVSRNPDRRVEEIAGDVGITTRAALLILHDLEESGYLRRSKIGRRTHYTVDALRPLRHPSSAGHTVAELLAIFGAASWRRADTLHITQTSAPAGGADRPRDGSP
ncbi:MAG TPA: transcriptional regulator [Dermatophilaceae bacterium]|nr:transcriptional regulator [Dermatophilaceae bacterium]